MKQPTHAVYHIINWNGEGDKFWSFAFKDGDEWRNFETCDPLLEYDGDEILKIVRLNDE